MPPRAPGSAQPGRLAPARRVLASAPGPGRAPPPRGGPHVKALELSGVTVRFGTGRYAMLAVDHVDLVLPADSVLGLVGESGSGKSTLARAIVGLVPVS